MDEIEELRNAAEDGDAALTQRDHQLLRVQRIEKDNLAAIAQRQENIDHLRQHVEERQHAKKTVARADGNEFADALQFGSQVAVGEHHALGIAGGSGGVNDGRNIVWLHRNRNKTGLRRQHHVWHVRQALVRGVQHCQLNRTACDGFLGHRKAALVHKEQGCATVIEQLSNLGGGESRVQWDCGIAAGDDAKIGRDPNRTIEGKDGTARASARLRCRSESATVPRRRRRGEAADR